MNITFSQPLREYLAQKQVATLTIQFAVRGCCATGNAQIHILPGIHFYDSAEYREIKCDDITLCVQDLVNFSTDKVSFDLRKFLGLSLIEAEGIDDQPDFSRRFA